MTPCLSIDNAFQHAILGAVDHKVEYCSFIKRGINCCKLSYKLLLSNKRRFDGDAGVASDK